MTLLVFNALVYGDPTVTGFHLGSELLSETANFSQESFFKARPDVASSYLRAYGPALPYVSLPLLGGAAWALAVGIANPGRRRAAVVMALGTTLVLGWYYGFKDAWGSSEVQLNASVLRYLLPASAFLYVFLAGACVSAARRWGVGIYVLPALIVVASASASYNGPAGVAETASSVAFLRDVRNEVVAATPENAVIASRLFDKTLFPYRTTMTATYMLNNEAPIEKGSRETWDFVPGPHRFADVAITVTDAGIPFYVIPDGRFGSLAVYQDEMKARGYYLRRIAGVASVPLYKVSRLPDAPARSDIAR